MMELNFAIQLPKFQIKELSDREKKWALQNEIYDIYMKQDIRLENWKRYVTFLRQYRINERKLGRQACIKRWKKEGMKDTKRLVPLTKASFGIMTCRIPWHRLYEVKSICQDKLNRQESIHCYLLSLNPLRNPHKAT